MNKLYPPIIGGTIPAFSGDIIKVPFQMNKAVSLSQIHGFCLKIKTVQSNRLICDIDSNNFDAVNNIVYFTLTQNNLHIGQYYKIQMAYRGIDGLIGYYSTIGIVKYTASPQIGIEEETDGSNFIGYYSQDGGDVTEKVYSYCFELTDSNGNIIETTGDQIHNNSIDENNYESHDTFILSVELATNVIYYLTYSVITTNGLEVSSAPKKFYYSESIDSKLEVNVKAILDYENGYIDVSLTQEKEKTATGSFILLRSSSKDNYMTWNEVLRFVLYHQTPARKLWKDMTVEQGVGYRYAIQQYNSYGLRSNKIYSDTVIVDFEHIFLFDGKRQLKVCYNPKVSSFKNTLLESKVDTIGSKYPFILRNGNVNYKEFPISGLISLLSDENNLFYKEDNVVRNETGTSKDVISQRVTDLTANNYHNERNFKLEALEWLTNGEPKLFRSPSEGNYLVRLLNVSLSPEDQLGRMLHSFSCTAYEIGVCDYETLEVYNIITTQDPTSRQLKWKSVDLSTVSNGVNLLKYPAISIHVEGMMPGDKIQLRSDENIVIGPTGSYIIDLGDGVEINHFALVGNENIQHQGILTYSYYTNKFKDTFDNINTIKVQQVPCRQFIGEHVNILEEMGDIKNQLSAIGYIRFWLRNSETVLYTKKEKIQDLIPKEDLYTDEECTNLFDADRFFTTDIYQVCNVKKNENNEISKTILGVLDIYNDFRFKLLDDKTTATQIVINEEIIDLRDISYYQLKQPKNITSIQLGFAIVCEVVYSFKVITYDVEQDNEMLQLSQLKYQRSLMELQSLQNEGRASKILAQEQVCRNLYKDYIDQLEEILQNEGGLNE